MREKLLTEIEAAELLALSAKTLRRWRWAGKGPEFVKIGGAVRYRTTDLDAFVLAGIAERKPQIA
jgi:excisionase family DNA binding protein